MTVTTLTSGTKKAASNGPADDEGRSAFDRRAREPCRSPRPAPTRSLISIRRAQAAESSWLEGRAPNVADFGSTGVALINLWDTQ